MTTLNTQRFHHCLWNQIHIWIRSPPLMPILILWIPGPTPRSFCSIRFQVMAPTSTLSTISITLRVDKPMRKSVFHRTRVSLTILTGSLKTSRLIPTTLSRKIPNRCRRSSNSQLQKFSKSCRISTLKEWGHWRSIFPKITWKER